MEKSRVNLPPAYATIAMVIVCIVMYLVETFTGGSENLTTLMKLGAMNNVAVVAGHQWWRLFTAQFLHIGIWHLVSNIVMIYYVGMIIEPMVGHFRFLGIYLLSGIGGNLLSLAFGTDNSIGAGASTALFGLFGAVIALGVNHRQNPAIQYLSKQALVLAVLNLGIDIFLPNIDIYGHLGGLITGFLLSMIVGDRLSGQKENPKLRVLAAAIFIIYLVLTIRQGMVISF